MTFRTAFQKRVGIRYRLESGGVERRLTDRKAQGAVAEVDDQLQPGHRACLDVAGDDLERRDLAVFDLGEQRATLRTQVAATSFCCSQSSFACLGELMAARASASSFFAPSSITEGATPASRAVPAQGRPSPRRPLSASITQRFLVDGVVNVRLDLQGDALLVPPSQFLALSPPSRRSAARVGSKAKPVLISRQAA